jgi:hypothetical protein
MSTVNSVLNAVTVQVTKMVEYLTPIAKQAYEVGLLVIRIDGLATLIPMIIMFLVSIGFLYKSWTAYTKYRDLAIKFNLENTDRYPRDFTDFAPGAGIATIFIGVFSIMGLILSLTVLLQVWLWVKVFYPQLWLAHEAMLKVLS